MASLQASIWVYPWDLLDGGAARVLQEIAELGVTGVHVAASYHSVHALLPHNPRRRTYLAERGYLYFQPRRILWQECALQPMLSPLLTEQGDALEVAAPICRDLNLQLVAWTVCLHNSDLGFRYPEVTVLNLRGERYPYSLCAAHPEVQRYLFTLMRDLQDRVDAIELEAPHWLPFPHHQHAKLGVPVGAAARCVLTLCFCPHCKESYATTGIDPDRLVHRLAKRLDDLLAEPPASGDSEQIEQLKTAEPDLVRVLAAREDTIASLVADLVRSAGTTPVQIMPFGPTWLTGANPAALAPLASGVSILAYGAPPVVAESVAQARMHIADSTRLLIGLSLLHSDTADRTAFFNALAGVRRAGIHRVGLYNYGLASTERLQWVRQALAPSRDEAP